MVSARTVSVSPCAIDGLNHRLHGVAGFRPPSRTSVRQVKKLSASRSTARCFALSFAPSTS